MSKYLGSVLKLKDSVDVYVSESSEENSHVQFYHINTRRKMGIEINHGFCELLARLDGNKKLVDVLESASIDAESEELDELFDYLIESGVVKINGQEDAVDERFSRQINFFEDWIFDGSGIDVQKKISDASCVIFGIGAVGGVIAAILARAGLRKITIVDCKVLEESSVERHQYFSMERLGESKVSVLKDYLLNINPSIHVTAINERVIPSTDLSKIIADDSSIVINTADEPYIGHISIKIGRYLWGKRIPLYVAGGFDAHLMSTGDFIIPGESFCVDCCSNHFRVALKDWKPNYKIHDKSVKFNHIIGGAGGTYGMSLFSASFAALQVVNFLAGGVSYKKIINKRGEFLVNRGKIVWVDIGGGSGCEFCSGKAI